MHIISSGSLSLAQAMMVDEAQVIRARPDEFVTEIWNCKDAK